MAADSKTHVSSCNMMDHGVPRLGVPPYMHLVETNTAVASACLADGKCSTNYPGPTGLGATFNRSLWRMKGEAMGDEIRAFNNLGWHRATGDSPYRLLLWCSCIVEALLCFFATCRRVLCCQSNMCLPAPICCRMWPKSDWVKWVWPELEHRPRPAVRPYQRIAGRGSIPHGNICCEYGSSWPRSRRLRKWRL